jgi:hypothetical protein
MQYGAFLYVAALTNRNQFIVAAQSCTKSNAGVGSEMNFANHAG